MNDTKAWYQSKSVWGSIITIGSLTATLVAEGYAPYAGAKAGIDEVAASYMISVPFPHEPDAQRKSVEMRAKAMAHLKEGGVISVFPSGVVASRMYRRSACR